MGNSNGIYYPPLQFKNFAQNFAPEFTEAKISFCFPFPFFVGYIFLLLRSGRLFKDLDKFSNKLANSGPRENKKIKTSGARSNILCWFDILELIVLKILHWENVF